MPLIHDPPYPQTKFFLARTKSQTWISSFTTRSTTDNSVNKPHKKRSEVIAPFSIKCRTHLLHSHPRFDTTLNIGCSWLETWLKLSPPSICRTGSGDVHITVETSTFQTIKVDRFDQEICRPLSHNLRYDMHAFKQILISRIEAIFLSSFMWCLWKLKA